jgi:cytochrome P450
METVTGRGGRDFASGAELHHLIGLEQADPERPICPVASGDAPRTWLITGYDAASALLRDPRLRRAAVSEALSHRGPALRMSITEMDQPEHARVRRLISGAFSARRIERLRPDLERTADRWLNRLLAGPPPVALHARFCAPLAFDSHCLVLGVPDKHRETLWRLSLRRSGGPDIPPEEVHAAETELHQYVAGMLFDTSPAPFGLFAELIAAHRERGVITERELTGIAASLFFDGHLLTANQITNSVLCLLTLPHALGIPDDPAQVGAVVEELLRFCPSVTMSMPRIATEDIDQDGVHIRAGDTVVMALPLVNRDRRAVSEPDRIDIFRRDRHHLSFGHGMHYCLGAHLARTLTQVALAALTRRLPGPALAVPEDELDWYVTPNMRGIRELPLTWRVEVTSNDGSQVSNP